jgi:probable HAF family extracellular repeat protein
MRTLRQLRNFWLPWVTTFVLGCFNHAFAQTSYKVTDLGVLHDNWNLSCAMSLNHQGWTITMNGLMEPLTNFAPALPVLARATINIGEFKIDLGTLGGPHTWMNWGGINDRGDAVGMSETNVPDPDGEDICGFGTNLTCSPFLWQNGHMSALPTVGGTNGQASDINDRGQVVGFAENGTVDSSCSPNNPNNRIQLPVLWEDGKAQALPTVGRDPDGFAIAINDQGQAVGDSGNCAGAIHGVLWENGKAWPLPDLGGGAIAQGINDQGQIVGRVSSPDGTTFFAALWQNGVLTNLKTLPGDFAALATGINNRGQVVGSTLDSGFNWSHAFIYQDGVMTDLNKLFPADSNLFATMADKINERGQIAGMGTVLSGPDKGDIHAFLATPTNQRIDKSIADVAPIQPKSNLPANAGKQLLQRSGLVHFAR